MATKAAGKQFSWGMRGAGALAVGMVMALAPLTSAVAASSAKKPAAKTSAKAPDTRKAAAPVASTKQTSGKTASADKGRTQSAGSTRVARASDKSTSSKASNAKDKRSAKAAEVAQAAPRYSARGANLAARETRLSLRSSAESERPARLSLGQMAGLHAASDPLDLKSSVALVLDQDTNEVLVSKNDHAVLPIASITKLMTGLIISDARLPLDEPITITEEDIDTEKGSRSRLTVGATLTRGELMHLALMSSENRAAHALGRTYPGGLNRFVGLMNARATMLGMKDTRYVEPTGLSSDNRSSASDLATLVAAASRDPLLRQLTTSPGYEVAVGNRVVQFNNTNRLVHSPDWQIGLQKTGYISEAGRCLVMQANVAGRKLIMVFLDSSGKYTRLADAERVRRWVELQHPGNTIVSSNYSG